MNRVRVQLELPSNFVPRSNPEHVPPVSHVPVEAERRRRLPAGTLVLEQQYIGAMATGMFLDKLMTNNNHEDLVFGSGVASAALLGSARLSLRGGEPVMRRHLHLPVIADPNSDARLSKQDWLDVAFGELTATTHLSGDVYYANLENGHVPLRLLHKFGHTAGDAGLWAAMLPYDEIGTEGTTAQVQNQVFKVGMNALETTRKYTQRVGRSLSLAMLAGQKTRLTTYVEERSSDAVNDALHDAQNEAAKLLSVE